METEKFGMKSWLALIGIVFFAWVILDLPWWLQNMNKDVKPPIIPVATSKLKVVSLTCIEVKARECMKWEVKEAYKD